MRCWRGGPSRHRLSLPRLRSRPPGRGTASASWREAWARVREAGFSLGNLDLVVVAEEPNPLAHVPAMRERLAGVPGVRAGPDRIKGKRERGWVSRGAGRESRPTPSRCCCRVRRRRPREDPDPVRTFTHRYLHVGNARTAIFQLALHAPPGGHLQSSGSRTPTGKRSRHRVRGGDPRELRWLGLDWDEGIDGADTAPTGSRRGWPGGSTASRWIGSRGRGPSIPASAAPRGFEADREADRQAGKDAALFGALSALSAAEARGKAGGGREGGDAVPDPGGDRRVRRTGSAAWWRWNHRRSPTRSSPGATGGRPTISRWWWTTS